MELIETQLQGCYIIEPEIYEDKRGSFFEVYNKVKLEKKMNKTIDFVQDNSSISHKGVLRGLHLQKGTYAQAKLVSVLKGAIIDVVVDLRRGSKTYGEHFKILLNDVNKKMIFIPKGMAHGFVVISDEVVFNYKCDNYYNKASEGGIIYSDKDLNIDWEYPVDELILSEKDLKLPTFNEYKND